ncbi:UNVERIFIED_CONTAM: E3 ubiquitin-protein ligase [Sesamum indicum]
MVRTPPLNSSNNCSIEVYLYRLLVPRTHQQSTSLLDEVRLFSDVQIDLKPSSSASSKVSCYGTTQEFSIPSDRIFSPGKCRETMMKMLDLMSIPFSLDEKQIQWKGFFSNGNVAESKSLENSQDLVRELVKFFDSFAENQLSLKNHRLYLVIRKIQTIAEEEFQQWKSFRENHPEEYFELVHSQPELRMLFRWEALKVLERVRVEKSGGGDLGGECSICLEELLKGEVTEVIRLPCSHVYHEVCILGWLRKKQSCPICRAKSPHIQIDHESQLSYAYDLHRFLN